MTADVSVEESRLRTDDIIDRVIAGERVTISRDGRRVAELRPIPAIPMTSAELLRRWSHPARIDYGRLLADLDSVADPTI
jgi:antitoxin (DNA-binding transcriptional repressor) of toxin-antitoxin stability system